MRRRPRLPTAALLLALLLALALPLREARACDCAHVSPRIRVATTPVVFRGRAVEGRVSYAVPLRDDVTRFAVDRVWKGDVGATIEVVSDRRDMCTPGFIADGRTYLVMADVDGLGRLFEPPCSGSTELRLEGGRALMAGLVPVEDILGPGQAPAAERPGPARGRASWIATGVLALLLLGGAVALARRRRRA